jgi:hypothetical protein
MREPGVFLAAEVPLESEGGCAQQTIGPRRALPQGRGWSRVAEDSFAQNAEKKSHSESAEAHFAIRLHNRSTADIPGEPLVGG